MTNQTNQPLWSVREVAAYLGYKIATIREMARRGRIPAYKISGDWRFDPSEVRAWLERQRVTTEPPEAAPPPSTDPTEGS